MTKSASSSKSGTSTSGPSPGLFLRDSRSTVMVEPSLPMPALPLPKCISTSAWSPMASSAAAESRPASCISSRMRETVDAEQSRLEAMPRCGILHRRSSQIPLSCPVVRFFPCDMKTPSVSGKRGGTSAARGHSQARPASSQMANSF